ncbi:MAG TPA: enoyl-CoA hydratase/isomerase family protein, partial [Acidimicrobiales bacterium]|nr:enoyl-CoA hydratase/isomerase family protein [Acidimicrobiales bacterium]
IAVADPALGVLLDGVGPSFSSGGDLDEFGSFPDPATAHAIRLTRSAARLLAHIGDRVEVRLHGSCLGAGIELAAFAGRVIAHPETTMGLPEVPLGLVPGAGGTASLPLRVGRQRTALLALTAEPIDPVTALEWGLIDEIS